MAAKAPRRKQSIVAEAAPAYLPRRILLDTHVWLWWFAGDRRLGRHCLAVIKQADEVHVSAASAWEIAIKLALGKLIVRGELDLAGEIERDGFLPLPITIAHADAVRGLPALHRDPFDRMLVAQARADELTIITADDVMSRYGVAVLDARK